jgi:hypothetical protein
MNQNVLGAFSSPQVDAIAKSLGIPADHARGLLLRWWLECGEIVDQAMGVEGFANALRRVGWMTGCEEAAQANGEAPPAKPTRKRKPKVEPVEQPAAEPATEPEVVPEAKPASKAELAAHQAELIYLAYPRRVARGAAIQAIQRALKEHSFQWLMQRVEKYRACVHGSSKKFIPHPATWFNQARYDDDESDWANTDTGPDLFGGIRQVQREMSDERGVQARRLPQGDGGVASGNAEDGDSADDQGLSSLPF